MPLMMHVFPLDVVAKEEKAVKINVARFHNGQWCSEDFQVRPGEMIGSVVERKPNTDEYLSGIYSSKGADDAESAVELIEFSTGGSLVDVVQTTDWTGVNRLQQRDYADVLYSKDDDDASISHLAVKTRNWPDQLQQDFAMIRVAESEDIQIRGRGQGSIRYQQGSPVGGMRPGAMPRGRIKRIRVGLRLRLRRRSTRRFRPPRHRSCWLPSRRSLRHRGRLERIRRCSPR